MRYSLLALAATTLLSSAFARGHVRRHHHSHAGSGSGSANCTSTGASVSVGASVSTGASVGASVSTGVSVSVGASVSTGASASMIATNSCVCTTYVTSYLVDYYTPAISSPVANATTTIKSVKTVVPIPAVDPQESIPISYVVPTYGVPSSSKENTTTVSKTLTATYTSTSLVTVTGHRSSSLPAGYVPTPGVTTISTPGVYTIPETTITWTETGYAYPPGTYIQSEVVVTVTVTSQVVTCPLLAASTTSAPVVITTTPAPAIVPTITSSNSTIVSTTATTPVIVIVPSSAATYDTTPAGSVVATPTSSSSAAPAQSSSPPKVISSNGNPWAVTYSPYRNGGGCKTADEVETDIASIASKGFHNVRIYSTDCSGLQNVGSSCEKHGLGIILGVFLKAGGVSTGDQQVQDIIAWGKWELIVLVVVGNESIFNGYCTAAELAAYIASVTGKFKSAGYNGPVTTTEPLNTLQQYGSALCDSMTVTGVNIHPFFNSATSADKAGDFLASEYALAEKVCPGKKVWVLESGWPSAGQPNGMAVPGTSEQEIAIKGMLSSVPGAVAFFTWTDDGWKAPGAYGVEPHFGCGELFTS